ncbi:L,D-transpeptidase family protein [Sphingomonas sp. 37zxx]|uniref:L,D-transpeptidase family protein n=1 Tax=Sphingomonas sp. 37zxx TaxID=1550073 RepID=UPI0009DEC042|nr:L,D-transpeptidase family protein [Sphingomonas sp. 37zxx]
MPTHHHLTALLIAALAGPAFAQVQPPVVRPVPTAPPARITPPAQITPPVQITPPAMQTVPVPPSMPMILPIAPLPLLSPEQASQLAALLAKDGAEQGLRSIAAAVTIPRTNDALVRAALDHAHAVHAGRLDTADFQADWALRPAAFDPLPGFAKAVAQDRIAQWFASLPPPWAGYDGLRTGLTRYRGIVAAGGWQPIAAGPDLSLGSKGPRVAALRKRLAIEDPEVIATGSNFDAELLAAVQRAQRRYGLNPAGIVSTQTIAALNVPARDRVRQIMANMERWRWLPHELPKNRIQVNIAAAVLTVFEGDSPVMSMKAVTGKPGGGETPMLASTIHSVVLNPPWNVPSSIANRELFPKGNAYLKANNFRIIGEGPNRRLQQASGDSSALGRFKFDFDNAFAVYLHDTPAQAGFSRFDRLASHGCIRLEKPAELAKLLLRDVPEWSEAAIDEQVTTTTKTVRARLNTPVEVYLLYWTAFASANGQMSFRADPYNWDTVLADKIERRSAAQVASR